MKVALMGLLGSGKSTILASLTGKAIPAAGSTSIEEAIVSVPDERFEWLAAYCKPKKTVHATIDCLDLPGFNFTDDHGRAAARRIINQIRTVELLNCSFWSFGRLMIRPCRLIETRSIRREIWPNYRRNYCSPIWSL